MCNHVELRTRINWIPLFAGLIPSHGPVPPDAGWWTRLLFEGAKDFHLQSMAGLRLEIGRLDAAPGVNHRDGGAFTGHAIPDGNFAFVTNNAVDAIAVQVAVSECSQESFNDCRNERK